MIEVGSTTEEKVPVTVNPTTSTGQPAELDGALTLEVITGLATIEQDPANPRRFFVISEDLAGQTRYRVSADADLGSGVVTISDEVNYTYNAALATSFGLVAGAPEPK